MDWINGLISPMEKKYRKYFAYIDDGDNVYKIAIPATCEESARNFCEGNGEIVAVKDVTEQYHIRTEAISEALKAAQFDKCEIDWICRALIELEIAE